MEYEHARGEENHREQNNRREAKTYSPKAVAAVEDLLQGEHPICCAEALKEIDNLFNAGHYEDAWEIAHEMEHQLRVIPKRWRMPTSYLAIN
jgi:hypothetical protein